MRDNYNIEFKGDHVKVYYHENYYNIKIEDIKLNLGVDEITDDIIIKYIDTYYI